MEGSGFLSEILNRVPDWLLLAFTASGAAAWVSAFLKSKQKNTFLQLLADTLNAIGGNVFKGKNADDDRQ